MLTRCLTKTLERREDLIAEYFVTDVSFALASSAAKGCSYPYAIPKTYDLSKPAGEQGFTPGSLDIVTAFHVLHATPDISSTLASLRSLLAPGGCLLVIELDAKNWKNNGGSIWHDFVFGCFAEWYGFTDARDHCAMSPVQWKSALDSAGFTNIQTAIDSDNSLSFNFSAQKAFEMAPIPSRDLPNPMFFTYRYGEEERLRDQISSLDVNEPLELWLLASEGRDGDAGSGVVLTLAREFGSWNIHIVMFPTSITEESERIRIISRRMHDLVDDQIIRFGDDGQPFVAKVVPSLPPSNTPASFDPAGFWTSNGAEISQGVIEQLRDNQVAVDVLAWSPEYSSWRGFVGTVVDSRDAGLTRGTHVVGIVSDALVSNQIHCEGGILADLHNNSHNYSLAHDALFLAISAVAVRKTRVARPTRDMSKLQILVPDSGAFGQKLGNFLGHPRFGTQVTVGTPSDEGRFNLIVVDSATAESQPELRSWLIRRTGKLFIWDRYLLEEVERDPWSIGDSLADGLEAHVTDPEFSMNSEVIFPLNLLKELPAGVPELPLFRGDKEYIILGGASDLGTFMSLWMYKVRNYGSQILAC
jgi:hypothetical protein